MDNQIIQQVLDQMAPITLEEMKNIHLMDRIDSKFVVPVSILPRLLEEMIPYFHVQTKNDITIAPYTTQYFDTPDLKMYHMHQNGKLNRQKIRIRSYVDSELSFLEIKNKNNKGRTKKIRIQVEYPFVKSIDELEREKEFLTQHSLFDTHLLTPVLSNKFNRITCVNNRKTERITIDVNLVFTNHITNVRNSFENIVVLELKQDGRQRSDFRDILMKLRIRKGSFSKYCMGTVMTNSSVKYNRFKGRLARIDKITR